MAVAPKENSIHVEKDVTVPTTGDGTIKADLFKPTTGGPFPAIVTMGVYNKDSHWLERYPQFDAIPLNEYSTWETPDPYWWTGQGYALVRADSPGTGASSGHLDPLGPNEQHAYYEVIEWAGEQPWCSGNVGSLGISYYAMMQWLVAALQPPHLKAIIPWEGLSDFYREWAYQGGIRANANNDGWWRRTFPSQQHGSDGLREAELAKRRVDWPSELRNRPLDSEWYRQRSPDFDRIEVPLLSAGNWHSLHLHLRGNTEGFMNAASHDKWLVIHSGNHVDPFYSECGRSVQLQFLDYWLKGVDNGLRDVPRVRVAARRGRQEPAWRSAEDWPLPDTRWSKLFLDAHDESLRWEERAGHAEVHYPAPSGSASFQTTPADDRLEITGPLVLDAWVSSTAPDMDMFVALRHIDADGVEIMAEGPHSFGQEIPMAMGWLRVSHRELDEARSLPYRPFHAHQREELLTPGEVARVQVELWPTSITLAPGERLRLVVSANDAYADVVSRSTGLNHDDPQDRNEQRFGGENTILTGGPHPSHLLVPVLPPTP